MATSTFDFMSLRVGVCSARSWEKLNREVSKPGGFSTFLGKGPDCVADPFGTVPRRCSSLAEKGKRDESGKSPDHPQTNRENPGKIGKGRKRTKKEGQVQIGKPPPLKPPVWRDLKIWTPPFTGCAKGAEKASCGETVVQKGGESVSSLPT